MGNCATCLSRELVHHCNDEEEESMMIRVLRTTDNELLEFPGPVFVKDLLFGFHGFAVFHTHQAHTSSFPKTQQQPLHPDTQLQFSHVYHLKPWVNSSSVSPLVSAIDSKPFMVSPPQGSLAAVNAQNREENMINMAHAAQREDANLPSPTKEKVVKKVRFAEELLVQTPSSNKTVNSEEVVAVVPSECLSTARKHEAHHFFSIQKDLRVQRPEQMEDLPASVEEEGAPYIVNKEVRLKGVVRLKVVISKKELTELMSSARMSGKQAEDAIMERMAAAVLRPPTTSPLAKAIKNSQSWRPSLNHIPEGPSCQEVF